MEDIYGYIWNQIDMIATHPVLQYYDVIVRDMLVIGAIV